MVDRRVTSDRVLEFLTSLVGQRMIQLSGQRAHRDCQSDLLNRLCIGHVPSLGRVRMPDDLPIAAWSDESIKFQALRGLSLRLRPEAGIPTPKRFLQTAVEHLGARL